MSARGRDMGSARLVSTRRADSDAATPRLTLSGDVRSHLTQRALFSPHRELKEHLEYGCLLVDHSAVLGNPFTVIQIWRRRVGGGRPGQGGRTAAAQQLVMQVSVAPSWAGCATGAPSGAASETTRSPGMLSRTARSTSKPMLATGWPCTSARGSSTTHRRAPSQVRWLVNAPYQHRELCTLHAAPQ